MIKKIHCLFILLLFYTAYGQHPIYTQFTEKDGLPDIEFYNVVEDSKGFIWLAADKGFYRYDGNEFKIYTNKEKRGLSVFEPREDHKGRVWCCNVSGQFFYVENDKLVTFIDLGQEINWRLGSFLITKTHLLVFASRVIYKISLETKKIEARVKVSDDLIGYPYKYKDEIYITTGESIITLDLELNITKRITSEAIYNDLHHRILGKSMIIGYKKKTYLRFVDKENKSSLYIFDVNTGQYQEIELMEELKNSYIVAVSFHNDQMLLSSSSGLWVYALEENQVVYKNRYFKNLYVSQLIVDKNENYWLTTLRNGVVVIPNINNYYYDFPEEIKDFNCIEKINEHTFFYGTTNGKTGFYNVQTHTYQETDLPTNAKINAALYDKNQELLYISSKSKSYIYDLKTKSYQSNDLFNNALSLSYLNAFEFFYTNYNGGVRIKNGKEIMRFRGVRGYKGFHDTISKHSYISYVDDFVKFDEDFKATKIRYQGKRIHAMGITKTNDGMIWASTFKDGIYGIQNDSVVINYSTKNGLISDRTQTIQSDGDQLWIITNKGIQLLDTKSNTFKTLTKSDGINTFLVSDIIPFKNHVVFATNKGIFSIDRKTAFQPKTQPEIYFTGIQINEKDTLLHKKYRLPHYQNAIKLSFNANGFRSKEHIRYFSRLLGYKDDWIPVDEEIDFVKYNSLPVGNYTFQVKAVSTSLAGESKIAAIDIAIESPFWKRTWFILIVIFILLLLIVLYYRTILSKREKQKNKELEKLAQERELVFLKLENLRSQMNPHFIFNALNSIQEYIILNKKNLASDYLGKFADLIRTYLNHSNRGTISLQDEIECLQMYLELEKLRFEDKLQYSFNIAKTIDTETVTIPTMLIQPYVENALKHGLLHKKNDRKLYITLLGSDVTDVITCIIEDNGIGREKAVAIKEKKDKMHQSFGTQATQDRLHLLNYGKEKQIGVSIEDLYDVHGQSCGTKVIITIPIKNL